MKDRYLKLPRAVTISTTSTGQVPFIFCDHRIIPYSIPAFLSADSRTELLNKFFGTLCDFAWMKIRIRAAIHRKNRTERWLHDCIITWLNTSVTGSFPAADHICLKNPPQTENNTIQLHDIETLAGPDHFQPLIITYNMRKTCYCAVHSQRMAPSLHGHDVIKIRQTLNHRVTPK